MYSRDYNLNDYSMERKVHLDVHLGKMIVSSILLYALFLRFFSLQPCLRIAEGTQWLQALCTESCHTCINPAQNNQCGPQVPFLGRGNEIKSPNWGLGLDQSCTIVNEVCQLGNPSQECNPVVDDMYAGHACPCRSMGDLYEIEHL